MDKKKLIINSALCDTRKVSEAILEENESVTINAAVVITNTRSRELLNKYNVKMNCANVVDVGDGEEGDVQVRTINGSAEIKSTDACDEKFFCIVNGRLTIGPGTEKVMENCVGLQINGTVIYPESMSGKLRNMKVNGSTVCYPDGAIVLKNNAVIDRTFALRAKNSRYWTAGRLIMVDPKLEPAKLEAKGATFSGKKAILTESNAEALVPLIDEQTELTIVPEGTVVLRDDMRLDEAIIKAKCGKLYILGDLTVESDAEAALDQVEYLHVRGDVRVVESLRDKLLAVADEISGDVRVIKGRQICDKINVRIARWMLEMEPDGICVMDCVNVTIDPDIPQELILRRLSVRDCVSVICAPEQVGALALVCEDVTSIGKSEELPEQPANEESAKVINSSDYVM